MYLINSFFVYSIIGYILEILFGFIIGANNPESGVLYGPWSIIYGVAAVLIIILNTKLLKKIKTNKYLKILIVFLSLGIILMILETIGGILIEKIFGFAFWNYTKFKFNIGKYTCLEMGLIWGLMGTIFLYVIMPYLKKYIEKIPPWLTFLTATSFLIDLTIRVLIEFNII